MQRLASGESPRHTSHGRGHDHLSYVERRADRGFAAYDELGESQCRYQHHHTASDAEQLNARQQRQERDRKLPSRAASYAQADRQTLGEYLNPNKSQQSNETAAWKGK
jgi:hypothetical protein